MPFEPGRRVGDYEVAGTLSTSEARQVYRVRNLKTEQIEALKVVLADPEAEPERAARIDVELRASSSLDHPNIVRVFAVFTAYGQLIEVMEFVDGGTFEQAMHKETVDQAAATRYISQILSALSYAHSRGAVSGNISPANLMLTRDDQVKLLNYGRLEDSAGYASAERTYCSPEQLSGSAWDARSDLYSTGLLLYELLAHGQPAEADPRPLREVNPEVSQPLSDVVMLALAKDPAQRFQSANAFANALRQAVETPVHMPAPGVIAQAPAPISAPATAAPAFTPVDVPGTQPPPAAAAATAPTVPVRIVPPVPPPSVMAAAPPQGSHRGVWIAIGAFAVLAVLIGAAIGLPRFLKARATADNKPAAAVAASPAPAAAQSTAVPPSTPASTPAADQANTSSATTVPAPAAAPEAMTAAPEPSAPAQAQEPASPRPAYGGTRPSASPHSSQAAQPAAPAPAVQPEQPAQPSASGIKQAQERMTQLSARASSVSGSVETLKHQQESEGYGLRRDMATAYERMNSDLHAADQALARGDADASQDFMDKADKEISTLEGLLGK